MERCGGSVVRARSPSGILPSTFVAAAQPAPHEGAQRVIVTAPRELDVVASRGQWRKRA
jgi:hypothetical protein